MGVLDNIRRSMNQVHFTYLGGHPDLPKSARVGIDREGDHINLWVANKPQPVVQIALSDITSVHLERNSRQSLGKAAAGALLGSAFGRDGLLAGAAIGGREKREDVVVLTIKYGVTQLGVLFGGGNAARNYPRFAQLLK